MFHPSEDRELLRLGLGITSIAARTTASADQLTKDELLRGAKLLQRKILRLRPAVLGVVGLGAYRLAFERPGAIIGLQPDSIGSTRIWLLPNTSGLNAHHQLGDLARLFGELRAQNGLMKVLASLRERSRRRKRRHASKQHQCAVAEPLANDRGRTPRRARVGRGRAPVTGHGDDLDQRPVHARVSSLDARCVE